MNDVYFCNFITNGRNNEVLLFVSRDEVKIKWQCCNLFQLKLHFIKQEIERELLLFWKIRFLDDLKQTSFQKHNINYVKTAKK